MIDFTLMNKALKCIWIKRFKLNENSAWTAIPNEATSHLVDKGVSTLENLLDHNLDFLTYEELKFRYQLKTNILTYYGVINAIPNEYKNL